MDKWKPRSIDHYEKFCSKCKHQDVDEHDYPCKECIDEFFRDWENRKHIHFERVKRQEKENKDG